jgi:disulfide bond formation protein DsbB
MMLVSAIVFSLAFVTILTAHAFEQFGGYPPCPLCLQERYAYYFAVPATLVAFFAARGNAIGFARIVLLLIAVGFLINAGVGVYHAGIEWKWWEGPATCAGATEIAWGAGGLAEQLENAQVIRCDEAPWHLLGLSFAGWNAVASAVLAALAGFGAALRR